MSQTSLRFDEGSWAFLPGDRHAAHVLGEALVPTVPQGIRAFPSRPQLTCTHLWHPDLHLGLQPLELRILTIRSDQLSLLMCPMGSSNSAHLKFKSFSSFTNLRPFPCAPILRVLCLTPASQPSPCVLPIFALPTLSSKVRHIVGVQLKSFRDSIHRHGRPLCSRHSSLVTLW